MTRIAVHPTFRLHPEADALEVRAEEMRVIVSTEHKHGRYPGWLVRVRRGEQVVDLRSAGEGSPWPVIAAALDDFDAAYPSWFEAEVLTVAAQSGLEITRA